jgi:hypothetical protein
MNARWATLPIAHVCPLGAKWEGPPVRREAKEACEAALVEEPEFEVPEVEEPEVEEHEVEEPEVEPEEEPDTD